MFKYLFPSSHSHSHIGAKKKEAKQDVSLLPSSPANTLTIGIGCMGCVAVAAAVCGTDKQKQITSANNYILKIGLCIR